MTIPYQHNCQHSIDGWCLECVKIEAEERATWKARAEKAESQLNEMKQHFDQKFISFDVHHPDGTKTELAVPVYNDTVGDQILTAEAIYHIDFVKAKYRMEKAEAERDALKSLCEKLSDYTVHTSMCHVHQLDKSKRKCTCGLDELLKQGKVS